MCFYVGEMSLLQAGQSPPGLAGRRPPGQAGVVLVRRHLNVCLR